MSIDGVLVALERGAVESCIGTCYGDGDGVPGRSGTGIGDVYVVEFEV